MSPAGSDSAHQSGDNGFVFESAQRFFYNTKKPVPVKEIVIALQGLEGVLKPLPRALRQLTGIEIARSEVLIRSLQSGSLIEDVVVRFFFKDKAGLDAFVDKLAGTKGMKAVAIAAIVGGVTAYGLHLAAGVNKATPQITATNAVIFENGAGVMNVSPEVFRAAIAAAVKGDHKRVAESALKVTSPVRADAGSSLAIGPDSDNAAPAATIPHAAVVEAPAKIELEANERIEEYTNAELVVRATDLDSKTRGWAGKLGAREERLPIELDPAVDPEQIAMHKRVHVDAALVFREKGRSHELKPARIYVRRVLSNDEVAKVRGAP